MVQLVEAIAKSLVDHPEGVEVSVVDGEQTTVFELKVAKEDLGKVIGKDGCIIKAVRTVLSASAAKANKKVSLKLED